MFLSLYQLFTKIFRKIVDKKQLSYFLEYHKLRNLFFIKKYSVLKHIYEKKILRRENK